MVNSAYSLVRRGEFDDAIDLLERSLVLDVEYAGVTAALKGIYFWNERKQQETEISNETDRADYLLDEWTTFNRFSIKIENLPNRCYSDFKHYVHCRALNHLLTSTATEAKNTNVSTSSYQDPTTRRYYLIGHCHKVLGDYYEAITYLERANRSRQNWPPILAELADSYDLAKQQRAAKIFFREAFYLGAEQISLDNLESPIIERLLTAIRDAGISESIVEWIPVYGTLLQEFNVTRELRPSEYGLLRQEIFKLEKRIGMKETSEDVILIDDQGDRQISSLVPRLINHYFWLVEHYKSTREEQAKADRIMHRLKVLDCKIYENFEQSSMS